MENSVNVNQTMPSNEERTMALLSHLSLVLGGILLPLIIWATQKDKSRFVRFHSLQSVFFHLSLGVIIVFLVFMFVIFIFATIGFGNLNSSGNSELPAFFVIVMISFYAFIILLVIAAIGYSIFVAVKSYKGELIRIFIIGNIIYKKVYGQS